MQEAAWRGVLRQDGGEAGALLPCEGSRLVYQMEKLKPDG